MIKGQKHAASGEKAVRSSFGGGILSQVASNALVPISSLLTLPLLAQALGVQGRGELAAGTAPYTLVAAALTLGLPEAVTNRVALRPQLASRYLVRAMALLAPIGLGSTIVVWLIFTFVVTDLGPARNVLLVCLFAIVPTLLLGVVRGAASGLGLWRRVAYERVVTAILRLVLLSLAWWLGVLDPLSAALVVAWVPVLGGLSYVGSWLKKPSGADPAQGLMGYGLQVWLGTVSGILLSRLDQTLMISLSNFEQLGLYVVAVSVSEIPLVINAAVGAVVFAAGVSSDMDHKVQSAARMSFALCSALALAMMLPAPIWIPLLLGDEYSSAVGVCWILVAAVVLGLPGSIAGSSLAARGRPGIRSLSLLAACFLNVAAIIILVPSYGAYGAAWATLAGNSVAAGINLLMYRRLFGVSPLNFALLRPADISHVATLAVTRFRRAR